MVISSNASHLDATFAALADPTRRAILARLALGEATVNELAEPFAMTQPAVSKHLKVLERAGLISRNRDAQRRPSRLEPKRLAEADAWLEQYRQFWEASFARLDNLLEELQPKKKKELPVLFYPESFKVSTPSDREIAVERDFDAPRQLVFNAFTKPELVRRWMLGPDGWTMPVCEIDLKVGGKYRYVWRKESTGTEMGKGGVFRQVARPEKLVATEKFDDAGHAGEAVDTTIFIERGEITQIRHTALYESKEARDTATRSGMEQGMAMGYDWLAQLLAALALTA